MWCRTISPYNHPNEITKKHERQKTETEIRLCYRWYVVSFGFFVFFPIIIILLLPVTIQLLWWNVLFWPTHDLKLETAQSARSAMNTCEIQKHHSHPQQTMASLKNCNTHIFCYFLSIFRINSSVCCLSLIVACHGD